MKKTKLQKVWLLLILLVSTGMLITLKAQTPYSAIWTCNSYDKTADSCLNTSVQATVESFSNLYITGYAGGTPATAQTLNIGSTATPGAWPALSTDSIANTYVQFAVTPATGNKLHINSLTFQLGGQGGNLMRAKVFISSSPNWSYKTKAYDGPDTSITPTQKGYVKNAALEKDTIKGLDTVINAGQTFYMRIYPWLFKSASAATGKTLNLLNVKINGTSINSNANISTFSFTTPSVTGSVNTTDHTVSITVPDGTDLTSLTPSITLSQGATISPASGTSQNFSNPVVYTVTAEDASTQTWTVTANLGPSSAKNILTFDFNNLTPNVIGVVNTSNSTVILTVPYGTDITALVPTITVSNHATISPATSVAENFTDSVAYIVTAQDASTKTWKVKVNISAASTDATLSNLQVNGTTISGFAFGTTLYNVVLATNITTIPTVTATTTSSFATAVIHAATKIPDTTKVVVTAQDMSTKTYNVIFVHPSTENWTIYDGSKTLNDPTNSYPFTLSESGVVTPPTNEVIDDTIIPGNKLIHFESAATASNLFTINPWANYLDSSKLTVIIRMRFADVTKDKNSDIDIYYGKNYREKWFLQHNWTTYAATWLKAEKRAITDTTLSDIDHWHIFRLVIDTAKGAQLYIDEKPTVLTGGAMKWINSAAVTPIFKLALGDGSGSTAYSTLYDYVIWEKGAYAPGEGPAIPSQLSTAFYQDSSINQIKISDTVYSAFNPKIFTYTVLLTDSLNIPTIKAFTNDLLAKAVVTPATKIPGATTVVVTAEDGKSKATYTFNLTVAGAKSNISSLSDLQVSGTTITNFSSATVTYNVVLPVFTTTVPSVTAMPTDSNATYKVTNAASLPGATTILVTAQDGSTTTYTINFTVAKSTDATLAGISYGTTLISNFKATTSHYSIALDASITAVPALSVTKSYATETYVISNAASLPGESTVLVTAEDGVTTKTYYVDFTIISGIGSLNNSEISCYPNPTDAKLMVKIANNSKAGIVSFYNLIGEKALSQSINSSENLIDVSSLQKGMYLLRINIQGKYYIQNIEVIK
jgi:hypothetical protein